MITQQYLEIINDSSCDIATNSTIEFPSYLETLFQGNENVRYPIHHPIKCYRKEIKENAFNYMIILPKDSTNEFFEMLKEDVLFCLNYFQFFNDPDVSSEKFNSFLDIDEYKSPQDMEVFSKYYDSSFKNNCHIFLDNIKPTNLMNYFGHIFFRRSYIDSFKNTYKQKYLVMKYIIHPALLNCKKLKKIVSGKSSCSFKIYDFNSANISEITKYENPRTDSILEFVEDIYREFEDIEKESIEIFESISDKIFSFQNKIGQQILLKMVEEKFNLIKFDKDSIDQFKNAIVIKENSYEDPFLAKAYHFALFLKKISVFGVGKYSRRLIDVYGVKIFVNTSNSTSSKFTVEIENVPEITYQFCYKILFIINKVTLIKEVEKLRNINLNQNIIEQIRSFSPQLNKVIHEYQSVLTNAQNENNTYRKHFFERIKTIPDQFQTDYNSFQNVLLNTVQLSEELLFYFSDIVPQMKANILKIQDLESNRSLITWIERVTNLCDDIIAIKVEQVNNGIRLKEII